MVLHKSFTALGLACLIAKTSLIAFMQSAGAVVAQNTSSCQFGSLYTFKSGDTLFRIAQSNLGNGNRWREIKKVDGSGFTDAEVAHLESGQQICIPGSTSTTEFNPYVAPVIGKGNLKQMLDALGTFESGLPSGNPNQYKVENSLGFMGKYQFGEPLLIDLGYYQATTFFGRGANKNYWRGTWTGKNGIYSKEQFQNSPQVQEIAIREAFNLNWQRLNNALAAKGQSINNYLGQQKTFTDRGTSKTVTISLSGVLAGAHLRGPHGVANLLLNNQVSHDQFGTSILRYMEEYGGYNVTAADLSGI